jgi:hypothetical protein
VSLLSKHVLFDLSYVFTLQSDLKLRRGVDKMITFVSSANASLFGGSARERLRSWPMSCDTNILLCHSFGAMSLASFLWLFLSDVRTSKASCS